jgi:hypothetical protein
MDKGRPPPSYPSEPIQLRVQLHLSYPMATTNGSPARRSPSRDYLQSNTTDNVLGTSGGIADMASHRGANRTDESLYSSSNVRGYVSAVDLREQAAGANSAADSGQLSLARPAFSQLQVVAPQAKTSKSFQPAPHADAEQFVPDRASLVRTPLLFKVQRSTLALATLTFGLSLARVQTNHMAVPSPYHPPLSLPIQLCGMILISLSLLVVP